MLLFPVQAVHCHLFMRVFFFFWPPPARPLPLPLLLTQQEIWKLCLSVCVRMNIRAYLTVRFCVAIFKCLSSALRWMQTSAKPPAQPQTVHEGQSSPPDWTPPPPALSLCASALLTVNHLSPSFPSGDTAILFRGTLWAVIKLFIEGASMVDNGAFE